MSHFSNKLIEWYLLNHRDLPWRNTSDPYAIWVSEIMLQQTQAITVIPYYHRFLEALPNIESLANAKESQLLKLWEGLGYYSRVRNMQIAAKTIVSDYSGVIPNNYDQLLKLKGIGPYTAGAISSIAYNQQAHAIDGNVMRVLSRLYELNLALDDPKIKRIMESYNLELMTSAEPNLYTQAMIELGATICIKSNPKCESCPVKKFCSSYKHHTQALFPVQKTKLIKKEYNYITLILKDNSNNIALVKMEEALLKGLYILPQFELESIHSVITILEDQGMHVLSYHPIKVYKHVFTHLVWHMHVYLVKVDRILGYEVVDHFENVAIATAHKKILK